MTEAEVWATLINKGIVDNGTDEYDDFALVCRYLTIKQLNTIMNNNCHSYLTKYMAAAKTEVFERELFAEKEETLNE